MSAAIEFNAQMYVSEQLTRQLVNTAQDVSIRCVQVLAEKYNFDADEAIRMLGLNMIKLERKAPEKVVKAKAVKVQAPKSAFPLPYNGEFNETCCYALRQNNGLYTQCTGIRKGEASFCKGCASQMQKVGAEMPEYGTIQQRMAVGIFEYVDPKGRKPIAYAKIMKKYKITEEQVLAEAGKLNIIINPNHFVVAEAEGKRGRPKAEKAPKEKGAKGRPKKTKKVLQIEGDDDDLFASLVAQANEVEDEEIVLPAKKKVKSDEEKEAERLAKEHEKAEKEKKRLAEKAEREAKLALEKEEKAAKKKAEEEARALKKQQEEEARALKKKQEEEARAAKKLEAEKAKAEKKSSKKAPVVEEEEEEEEKVKKIEFEGKKYLKSLKSGIIYDYNKYVKEQEQVVVGKWSEATNKIIFDDAEESEEEYD